jgi:hypothetical protein
MKYKCNVGIWLMKFLCVRLEKVIAKKRGRECLHLIAVH